MLGLAVGYDRTKLVLAAGAEVENGRALTSVMLPMVTITDVPAAAVTWRESVGRMGYGGAGQGEGSSSKAREGMRTRDSHTHLIQSSVAFYIKCVTL